MSIVCGVRDVCKWCSDWILWESHQTRATHSISPSTFNGNSPSFNFFFFFKEALEYIFSQHRKEITLSDDKISHLEWVFLQRFQKISIFIGIFFSIVVKCSIACDSQKSPVFYWLEDRCVFKMLIGIQSNTLESLLIHLAECLVSCQIDNIHYLLSYMHSNVHFLLVCVDSSIDKWKLQCKCICNFDRNSSVAGSFRCESNTPITRNSLILISSYNCFCTLK